MKSKTRKAVKAKSTRNTKAVVRKGATAGNTTLTLSSKLVSALKEKAKANKLSYKSFARTELEKIAGI